MKALILLATALALVGCQYQPKPDVNVPQAAIDQKIAKVSEDLARYCATAQLGIALLRAVNTSKKPEVTKSLAAAEAGRSAFCSSPPRDVNTAIVAMASIATDVIATWRTIQ